MYYKADIYLDSYKVKTCVAGDIKVLKDKVKPYIEDEKVTQIIVSEVEDIGFFKLPKELAWVIEEDKLL